MSVTESELQTAKRLFIQCIMSRKTLPMQEVNDILTALGVSHSAQEFVREVNADLSFLDMKLQTGKDPIMGMSILCMVHLL
jgi:hypothetical protein